MDGTMQSVSAIPGFSAAWPLCATPITFKAGPCRSFVFITHVTDEKGCHPCTAQTTNNDARAPRDAAVSAPVVVTNHLVLSFVISLHGFRMSLGFSTC